MADPYWSYGATADRGSIPRPNFPGFLSSEPPSLASHHPWNANDMHGSSSEYVPKESAAYGVDAGGIGLRPEPTLGGLTAGASIKGHQTPLRDPILLTHRPDVSVGFGASIPDIIKERPSSSAKVDGLPAPPRESNILFVDGLPSDCSRREVGHLFRPFIGFKEIKVVHKEPRRNGDKAMVLCFVEFKDAKCAITAMEALQGYKFDDKKTESPILRIHFAHFPFRLPSEHGDQWFGGSR